MNAAAPPLEPAAKIAPVADAKFRVWMRRVAKIALLAAPVGVAVALLQGGAAVALSAAGWLGGLEPAARTTAPIAKLAAKLVARMPAEVRGDPQWAAQWLQLGVAAAVLSGVMAVGRTVAGWTGGVCGIALVLLWPDARASLATLGAESVLAAAVLWAAWAGMRLPIQPLRGGLGLAMAASVALLASPAGLLLAPLLLFAGLVMPMATAPDSLVTESGRPDLPAGNRWLAWTGAAVLAVGLCAQALHGQSLKAWGSEQMAVLRAPADAPQVGWVGQLPIVGYVAVLLLQVPIAVTVLAGASLLRGWGNEVTAALGGAAGAALCLLATLAVCEAPASVELDPVRTLAPMWCTLAGIAAARRGQALWREQRWRALAVWAAACAACVVAEGRLLAEDRRNVFGRIPGLLHMAEPFQPAAVTPADVALLQRYPFALTLLPARPGGMALGNAIKDHLADLHGAGFSAPHRAQYAVLPEPPRSLVDRAFADHADKLACGADLRLCVWRIAGRTPRHR